MLKLEWARQFGSTEGDFDDPNNYLDHGLTIDRSGNVFIAGTTFGDIDSDGDPLIGGRSESNPSIWLAKYSNNGSRVFIKEFETTFRDDAYGITTGPNNNVYVSGGSLENLPGIGNDWPAWFSTFDVNGNLGSRVNIDFTGRDEDARDIAVSSLGDVYLAGTDPTNLSGAWVAKYSGGTQQWVKRFNQDDHGITSDDVANSIAVDSQNSAIAVGWTNGSLKGPALDTNSTSDDAWVAKYSSSGAELWKKQIGTSRSDRAFGVAVDSSDNIFVAGTTDGQFSDGRAGSWDAFVVKYNSNGNEIWRRQIGVGDGIKANDSEYVYDIDTDNSGNVYLIGRTSSDLDVVENVAPRINSERFGSDAFVAKYSKDGILQWANRIENTTSANGIDIDDDGNIYLSGPTHSGGFVTPNAGEGSDVWVAKFSQPDPLTGMTDPVYRFYNSAVGYHFYTSNTAERDSILQNFRQYRYEGESYRVSNTPSEFLDPVYRFYNTTVGNHFFTTNEAEKDSIIQNFKNYSFEGVAYYVLGASDNVGTDVHRFYNTQTGAHFYTANDFEKNDVLNNYPQFRYEGPAFEVASL